MTVFLAEIFTGNFFPEKVNLRFSLDFLGHCITYHARFRAKKFFLLWSKTSMFPDHVILTKILGSRSRVFVDRIVRFGAMAESGGVILEKWTKFY